MQWKPVLWEIFQIIKKLEEVLGAKCCNVPVSYTESVKPQKLCPDMSRLYLCDDIHASLCPSAAVWSPYDPLSVLKLTRVEVAVFLGISTVEFSSRLCFVFISVTRDVDPCWNAVNVCMLRSVKELPHWERLMPNSRNKTIGLESKGAVLLNLLLFFCIIKHVSKTQAASSLNL